MATQKMTHYVERAQDDKTACGRVRQYAETVTADRPIYHPTVKRMMRAGERKALALRSVTCKRCRKLAGAA